MLEITVINCDDKEVQYEWASKREFIDDIDSDNQNIPMLDDVLTAVDTDDNELHNWWKNTDGITVGDLYEECNSKLKNFSNTEKRRNKMSEDKKKYIDEQKYIDAYKEYYNAEKFDVEECDNDYYFDFFVDDFKAMEGCKTYGELADWFVDYIDNKGLTEGLYDVINGEVDDIANVEEWIEEVEGQFRDIALWVERVANGDINRDEPIDENVRNILEEKFAYEEYENGDDFLAICHTAQSTEKGEITMNNEKTMNNDLPTFGYSLEIGVNELVNFAFNKADGLDIKDCLLEEMEYNQEPFIERLEENLKLPTTEEAEDVYYDIDADEWSSILNVKYADIRDINGYGNGSNPTVTVNVDITVNTMLFADICKEHGLEIAYNKITLDMLKPGSEYGEINLVPNNDAFMYTEDDKCINAEYECWFDVDKVFGTNTKNYDDRTVDFYTDYYPEDGHMTATVTVKDSNGGDTDYNYDLSDKEKEFLLDMMEEEAKREGYESLIDMWQKETGRDNPEMEK